MIEQSANGSLRSRRIGGEGGVGQTNLLLGIGPAGNLDDHVENGLLLVGVQGNVMEGRDDLVALLNVDAMVEGVLGRNLADGIFGSHCGLLLRILWPGGAGEVTSNL